MEKHSAIHNWKNTAQFTTAGVPNNSLLESVLALQSCYQLLRIYYHSSVIVGWKYLVIIFNFLVIFWHYYIVATSKMFYV